MSDRVQIVLGTNPADNVRACLRALMAHPYVHWVDEHLYLTKVRPLEELCCLGLTSKPKDSHVLRTRETAYAPKTGESVWQYTLPTGHVVQEGKNFCHLYEKRVRDTLVASARLDRSNLLLTLSEVVDFFQQRKRKLVSVAPPASLIRLLVEAFSYEPFVRLSWVEIPNRFGRSPYSSNRDALGIGRSPLIWVEFGMGEAAVAEYRRKRLRDADIAFLDHPMEPEPEQHGGFVYFIGRADGEGLVKIGYAADPEGRLSDLQTGSPMELVLIGTVPGSLDYEHQLHGQLAESRRHGEWFERHAALALLQRLQVES